MYYIYNIISTEISQVKSRKGGMYVKTSVLSYEDKETYQ